jgi:signal transduction histidine kinase
MRSQEDKLRMLRQLEFFEKAGQLALEDIAQALQYLPVAPNDCIVRAGEDGDTMFILAKGKVRIHREEVPISELEALTVFGEVALLDTEPRSASVTALTECEVYALHAADCYATFAKYPEIMEGIVRMLIRRMRNQNETIIANYEARERELTFQVELRTAELQLRNAELERTKSSLEQALGQISAKNEEIEKQNKRLEDSLSTIQTQQEQIVQNEKVAAIGLFVPIVAHVINTPIGAINASISNLENVLPRLIRSLPEANDALPNELHPFFWHILEEALKANVQLTTRQEREAKRTLERVFEDQHLYNPEEIADKFVKIGIVDHVEDFMPLLHDPKNVEQILDLAFAVAQTRRQLETISQSTVRAKTILDNLNQYVYKREDPQIPIEVQINDSIMVFIALFDYYLMQGIELDLQLGAVKPLIAFPEELYQVWTNILMNAYYVIKNHSPNGTGKIRIFTTENTQQLQVRIGNDGPPIPTDDLSSIFDYGYKTHHRSEGPGVGLAICQSIIHKHAGHIHAVSTPEWTEFIIDLPFDLRVAPAIHSANGNSSNNPHPIVLP